MTNPFEYVLGEFGWAEAPEEHFRAEWELLRRLAAEFQGDTDGLDAFPYVYRCLRAYQGKGRPPGRTEAIRQKIIAGLDGSLSQTAQCYLEHMFSRKLA